MADSVTYTGLISFAGREFRYSYRGPTQQAIDSKVAELKSNNSNNWKTDDQLKVDAASKLMLEARTEAANKAISFLSDATKKKLKVFFIGILILRKFVNKRPHYRSTCFMGKRKKRIKMRQHPVS